MRALSLESLLVLRVKEGHLAFAMNTPMIVDAHLLTCKAAVLLVSV